MYTNSASYYSGVKLDNVHKAIMGELEESH